MYYVKSLVINEIAGAILDVFTHEPIEKNSKLWDIPNLVITLLTYLQMIMATMSN